MEQAGMGRTELASQSEAAHITHLFVTKQSGVVGLRGSHDKQSLLRPEPRLDVTSVLLVI